MLFCMAAGSLKPESKWSFVEMNYYKTMFRIPERFLPGKFDIWFQSHQVKFSTKYKSVPVNITEIQTSLAKKIVACMG